MSTTTEVGKSVRNLSRDELNELKQRYVSDMVETPSYGELADSSGIPDEVIYAYFEGVVFVEDDFFCNQKVGGGNGPV